MPTILLNHAKHRKKLDKKHVPIALDEKDQEVAVMRAVCRLNALQKQHRALVDEFETLSEKYIYTKKCALDAAWRFIPKYSYEFKNMPKEQHIQEDETRVGNYKFGKVIGSGQYSVVNISNAIDGTQLAIKRIKKDQIRSAEGVVRVEREITALKELAPHTNILELKEVIHGSSTLYLITEKCSVDLFDFIDNFQRTMDDNTAGVILRNVLCGLDHMWMQGKSLYCNRNCNYNSFTLLT
jgi:hypothetical protein